MLTALILIGFFIGLIFLFAYLYRAPDLRQFDTPRAALLAEEREISDAHDNVVAMIADFVAASMVAGQPGLALNKAETCAVLQRRYTGERHVPSALNANRHWQN